MRAWEKPGDKISNRMEELSKVKHMKGSVNKWTAHAPNAMAMLWVASIGKYGTIQLDGIVGIPDVKVDAYYAKASAAADAVINSQTNTLYELAPRPRVRPDSTTVTRSWSQHPDPTYIQLSEKPHSFQESCFY